MTKVEIVAVHVTHPVVELCGVGGDYVTIWVRCPDSGVYVHEYCDENDDDIAECSRVAIARLVAASGRTCRRCAQLIVFS